jgi:hypothetical protein
MYRASRCRVVIAAVLLAGVGFPSIAVAEEPPPQQLLQRTANMIGKNRLQIGILSFDYGILDRLSIGTDPPAWAARAVLSLLIPNLHLKFQVYQRGPISVAVQGAGYLGALKDQGSASGTLTSFPLSLFGSFRVHQRLTLHGEGTFVWVRAYGTGSLNDSGVDGQVASQSGQLGLVAQIQLTRIVSLTAVGRYQVYTGKLAFEGSGMLDPYTTASVDGTAEPRVAHPWQAVAGVALLWRHFHLTVGAGYGYYFIPGMDIAYPKRTFVPDLSASVLL